MPIWWYGGLCLSNSDLGGGLERAEALRDRMVISSSCGGMKKLGKLISGI